MLHFDVEMEVGKLIGDSPLTVSREPLQQCVIRKNLVQRCLDTFGLDEVLILECLNVLNYFVSLGREDRVLNGLFRDLGAKQDPVSRVVDLTEW